MDSDPQHGGMAVLGDKACQIPNLSLISKKQSEVRRGRVQKLSGMSRCSLVLYI